MVENPGTPARTGGLLPLNLPQPATVDADDAGLPSAVLVREGFHPVVSISDEWRIDDEWWRTAISRQYYAVILEDGMRLTLFRDLVTGNWFTQQYTAPTRLPEQGR